MKFLCSFALAGFVALGAAGQAAAEPSALTGPQIGAPAPAFSLKTIDGKVVSLADYKGKTLVVNVWATWCPPCRQEMPDLIATAPRLMKSEVAFLGVDTTEEAPIVRSYAVAKGLPYPQAIDRDKSFATAYDVRYFPTTYVIDPAGVLRARYIDVIGPAQLTALTQAAAAGRSVELVSPLQKKIDATLAAVPSAYGSDAATVEAAAKVAESAIRTAEDLLDQSDAASGNSTDLLRTRAEEATVRDAAIAALAGLTAPPADASLLPRLRGDAASDREQWTAAVDAYTAALAADPKNADALSGIALAAARLERYQLVVDADTKLAALQPHDVSALVDLARAQAKAGDQAAAVATFGQALAAGKSDLDAHPGKPKQLRLLAWAHLYAGRNFAQAGDAARARAEFDQTIALAGQLPPKDARHDMYLEEGQEAIVALGLGAPARGAVVSLVPWTGADLPGSIPNTIKYRLVVADVAGRSVTLRTSGVPKGWVASFCSDRVCAPFRVSVAIPESGVKVVEFQLVPPAAKAPAPKVRVSGSDGAGVSFATT
jgi:peroxiredoxin/Flp pilus assembly protein TadD